MHKTPLVKIDDFYIKREDLNATGSAKDRAIGHQVSNLIAKGFNSAVISSTGNAAISAIYYCRQSHIDLTIFVSPTIDPNKLTLINKSGFKVIQSHKAISDAFKFAKTNHAYNLRQSTDPVALAGYQTIGQEILDQLPKIDSIYVPVGSGTSLLGISQSLPKNVKIYAVQPASNPHIAKFFDQDYQPESTSLTDSLTAKFTPLKNQIKSFLKNRGGGCVVSNQQVDKAYQFLLAKDITTSYESALALAGYFKSKAKNLAGLFPVIIFSGARR